MRIAIMGSYPTYPYTKNLRLVYRSTKSTSTYWNYTLFKALCEHTNTEVHFVTYGSIPLTKVFRVNGGFFHLVGHPPRLSWINSVTDLKFSKIWLNRILNKIKPDIVYGVGTDHEYAYVAQNSGYPYVVKVGGVMNQVINKESMPKTDIRRLYAKHEREIVKQAKHIISPVNYVAKLFSNETNAEFHIVPNPIEVEFFDHEISEDYDILYIGRIYRLKRLLNLVKAVYTLSKRGMKITTKIAGAVADKEYMEEIKNYITEYKIAHMFQFMGPLSRTDLAKVLSRCKVLAIPSAQESAPMVISEAMAMGKPIVATNVGGISEMVEDGATGYLVPADDINPLGDKLSEMLLSKKKRLKFGSSAKEKARSIFAPEKVAEKNIQVFETVLSK